MEVHCVMKNFFYNIRARLQQWMVGRYGYDELSYALSGVSVVGLFLSCIPHLRFFYLPALLLWGWALFRCCSKQRAKRQREREAYLRLVWRIKSQFIFFKKAWKERKTYRYYRCKKCHSALRVPKGKGKIKISCPSCHSQIIKKT
jgi:hypothetical protein